MSIQVSGYPEQTSEQTLEQTTKSTSATSSAAEKRAIALTHLLNLRPELPTALASVQALRDRASVRLQELAIPSTRDEEWRFTDLSKLMAITFDIDTSDHQSVGLEELQPYITTEAKHRLVFVNGRYCDWLSTTAATTGLDVGNLYVGNLVDALQQEMGGAIAQHLGQQSGHDEVFTLLNAASFVDSAVVYVGKNQDITEPIELIFVSLAGASSLTSQSHCLVIAEPGSRVTLVEQYIALGQAANFNNAVTEVWVAGNAEVNHTRVQQEQSETIHIGKTAVSQARDSRYTCNAITLGAALSRHNLEVYQTGEQTETTLSGLTMVRGQQIADLHSAIALNHPHGTTDQLQKNIVDDRAHAIFNGKVFVPQAAQLTDAAQLNRNLLLSDKARVDTKPQLEIVADNVKCAHGATVSQLEEDEVFYLQSRGIDQVSAQKLLVYAFAYEVCDRIPVDSLKQRLEQQIQTNFIR
jgi:Fe-S cluster assembly protein SufD